MNGNGDNRFKSWISDTWRLIVAALISSVLSIGGYNVISAPSGLTGNSAIDVAVMNERVKQNKSRIDENYEKMCQELKALNAKVEQINESIIELQVLVKDGIEDGRHKSYSGYRK